MITWYAQQQRTSCVAACIRIALSSFGQLLSEKRVRQLLGAARFGHSLTHAWQRLKEHGLDAELHDDWSLVDLRDCLRDGRYPIVGVDRQFLGHAESPHAIVLTGIGSQGVEALDPLGNSAPETFSLETFERAWNSAGH